MQGHTETAMGVGSEHASKAVTEVVEQTGLCQLTSWRTWGTQASWLCTHGRLLQGRRLEKCKYLGLGLQFLLRAQDTGVK